MYSWGVSSGVYLVFCLNFSFLLAHGWAAILTLESDGEAQLLCLLNTFGVAAFGLGAAAFWIPPFQCPTCGGIPGELEQMETTESNHQHLAFRHVCIGWRELANSLHAVTYHCEMRHLYTEEVRVRAVAFRKATKRLPTPWNRATAWCWFSRTGSTRTGLARIDQRPRLNLQLHIQTLVSKNRFTSTISDAAEVKEVGVHGHRSRKKLLMNAQESLQAGCYQIGVQPAWQRHGGTGWSR